MSTNYSRKHWIKRWLTLKGVAATILFLITAALAEWLVVFYSINLGVKDETMLWLSFQIPETVWTIAVAISPLFHLVPLAVTMSLTFSWICLTKYVAFQSDEMRKQKVGRTAKHGKSQKVKSLKKFFNRIQDRILKVKGITYLWKKVYFARATIKSAFTVLFLFWILIILTFLLAYPRLIYQNVTSIYKNDPSLLNFATKTSNVFASVGIFSFINDVLRSAAPSLRNFILNFGFLVKPLADLDNLGKYLVVQNIAAWVPAFAILFYREYKRKNYRYKKKRR